MGSILTAEIPAPTHDLIRLREPSALAADGPPPDWVEPALRRAPWVVVRRGRIRAGRIPVGVRGLARSQRFAAWLAIADVAERCSPESLVGRVEAGLATGFGSAAWPARHEAQPVLEALAWVALLLKHSRYRWGPGGSVGFELATGAATVTAASDLDIILRMPCRLTQDAARELQKALADAATPVRIDVLLETPLGGVSLAELAHARKQVLLRSPDGVRLEADPWDTDQIVGLAGVS